MGEGKFSQVTLDIAVSRRTNRGTRCANHAALAASTPTFAGEDVKVSYDIKPPPRPGNTMSPVHTRACVSSTSSAAGDSGTVWARPDFILPGRPNP